MKIFRTVAAIVFLLACVPAFAQQVQIHGIPIGKGAGNTGFNVAVPGTAGVPFVSQGATIDPAFGPIGNSGFAVGPANTAKGTLDGVSTVDLPLLSCTGVNQAWRYANGVGINCGNVSVTTGFDMPINLGLSASASGGALTINLTQANNTTPSSSNPVLAPFRSLATTNGGVAWATISSALSLTIPNGATLGTSNGVPFRIWLFLDYNGGTPAVGAATCSNSTGVFPCASWEQSLKTSVTIDTSADTGGVLYATTGVTLDAVRIIGFCDFASGLTTAGTYASACTTLQVFGPGIKKPGEVVQSVYFNTAGTTSCNSTSFSVATAVTASITPSSTINLVEVSAMMAVAATGTSGSNLYQISRGAAPTLLGQPAGYSAPSGGAVPNNSASMGPIVDAPGVASAQPYTVYCKNANASFTAAGGTITLKEIQG